MAKNSIAAYGAVGKSNVLFFEPEKLTLVTDEKSALYDERVHLEVDESLVLSIIAQGIIEPVVVRKNPESGATEVVAGRQRVKAAIEANRRLKKQGSKQVIHVPATVRRGAGDEASFDVMVAENEVRKADSPLVRANKMRRAIERGRTEAQIATIFGCSVATVKNLLGTLEASAPVRKALEAGTIAASDAYRLSKLEVPEQKEKLAELVKRAPKVKGKRRKAGDGKRARAATGLRAVAEVTALRTDLEKVEAIRENDRRVALAVLAWVLGDDHALASFYDAPEPEVEEAEDETAATGT